MHRSLLVGCLLVVALASGGAVATAQDAASTGLLAQPEGFDETTFEITIAENGSARWSIQHHRRLANDSEVQQFQDFADRFESEETDLYRNFVSRSETLTAIGRNATDRPMEAKSFDRDAYTNVTASFDDRGTIALEFTWTYFARTEGERVIVGDVFGENFYIGPEQSIVFVRGEGLQFAETDPEPASMTQPDSLARSESVTWEGERSFAQQRPYLALEPRRTPTPTEAAGATDAPETTGAETTTTEPMPSGTDNPVVWLVGALILVLGLGSAIAYRNGSVSLPKERGTGDTVTTTDTPEAGGEDSDSGSQTPIPDEELLSDDDRVIQLLEDNGGRMKQVNIVEETEWSKSKVSMLLSDMEEEGQISKLRVGRENIISLSGHEPDAAGSPFDDEE